MNYSHHHTAISVRNLDESLVFYQTLGFREVHRYSEDNKTNVHLKLGIYFIEMFAYAQNQDVSTLEYEIGNNIDKIGVKHMALHTDDVDAALEDLKNKGLANNKTEIMGKGAARFFFIKDPDGMWVEIIKDDRYS